MRVLEGEYAIHRLAPDAPLPEIAPGDGLVATVRTGEELAIVCPSAAMPLSDVGADGWAALAVVGPLDLALTGIAARFTAALAGADVPVFVVSSYDTDFVLVPAGRLAEASAALCGAGIEVAGEGARTRPRPDEL